MKMDLAGLAKLGLDCSCDIEKFESKFASCGKYKEYDVSLGVIKTISKEKKKSRSRRKEPKAFDLSNLSIHLPELNTPKKTVPAKQKDSSKTKKKQTIKEGEYSQRAVKPHRVYLNTAYMYQQFEIILGKRIKKVLKRRQKKQEQRVEKLLEGMEKLDI